MFASIAEGMEAKIPGTQMLGESQSKERVQSEDAARTAMGARCGVKARERVAGNRRTGMFPHARRERR